jgi:diguanylate cyclase (GGDEF)-like protein
VRGALLPLMVVLESADTAAKVTLFERGVDEILVGPVAPDELAARVSMMLRRYRKLGAVLPDADSIDRKKITFLQEWARDPSAPLKPATSTDSHIGYTYEKAREHFACAPGAEVDHLEDLATRMCLERKFFDRIHLCPQCSHYAINFREVSPKTKSPDISRVDMLHHFKCGHVAAVRDFISGLDYVCPKCTDQLRHIGVDYERLGEMYLDNDTGETFADPETDCVCLSCGLVTDPERLAQRNVYVYTISERGLLAAETGYLYEVSLDAVLMDHDLQIYNPTYFQRQMAIELERAKRYRHHVGLALLRLDQYEGFLEQYGEKSRLYLTQVAETIRSNTRASDLITRHEHNSIILLFPETDLEGTRNACEKLRNAVLKLKAPRPDLQLTTSCGVTAYPEVAESAQDLLKSAAEGFGKAHAMGGNVVVVAGTAATGKTGQ